MKRVIIAIEKIRILVRTRHFLFFAPIVVLFSVLVVAVCTGQTAEKAIGATVVDIEGKSYSVTDLKALYTVGGMWIGPPPSTLAATLYLKLEMREGRITTTEEYEFPFSSIRRLVYDLYKHIARIELVDGVQIVLTSDAFEKIEVGGAKRTVQLTNWLFVTKKNQYLDVFMGRSKTQTGKEGEFRIYHGEIRSIDFR